MTLGVRVYEESAVKRLKVILVMTFFLLRIRITLKVWLGGLKVLEQWKFTQTLLRDLLDL